MNRSESGDGRQHSDPEYHEAPNSESPDEVLESMLDQTRQAMQEEGYHQRLTDYVREHRLPSKFDFDNLTEMVRCVLNRTRLDQLAVDQEECIAWVANCIYEDPVAQERTAQLWDSIVQRIQGKA